jgi:hypothetical protein
MGHGKEERLTWKMSLILKLNRRPGFARLRKKNIPKRRGWFPSTHENFFVTEALHS